MNYTEKVKKEKKKKRQRQCLGHLVLVLLYYKHTYLRTRGQTFLQSDV